MSAYARSIGRTEAFGRLAGAEVGPGAATRGAALEAWIRENVLADYHPIRTCRMAPENDPLGVVDRAARVRGVNNLHVIDASIIPVLPRASINMTVIAVAEKLAAHLAGGRPA